MVAAGVVVVSLLRRGYLVGAGRVVGVQFADSDVDFAGNK